jgi:hypothetical protein
MFKTIALTLLVLCTSCTYSIVMNHTEGTASDLVDETHVPTATIDTNVSVVP